EGRDFTLLEVGSTQERVDAMRDSRAVGGMLSSLQTKELVGQGFRILDSINRLYTHYAGGVAARREWAQQNQGLLVRYLRAHVRGIQASGEGDGVPTFDWDGLRE